MSSFLHSPAWEQFQEKVGHHPLRHDDQLYFESRLPFVSYMSGYRLALSAKHSLPSFPQATFARLEPLDERSLTYLEAWALEKKRELVPTFSVQPRQTSLVNIQGNEDELLGKMNSKHRYNIRLALKHGVAVEIFSQNLEEHFERFWQLLATTAERQDFRTHPRSYYLSLLQELEKHELVHLAFARYKDEDIATLLLITYKDTATYLHGASSKKFRNVMGPFALHWEVIKFSQKAGHKYYDLWGTDAEFNKEKLEWEAKPGASSEGVTRFKLGFGGQIINYPGTYDLIFKPFCYTLYKVLRALRGGKRAFH